MLYYSYLNLFCTWSLMTSWRLTSRNSTQYLLDSTRFRLKQAKEKRTTKLKCNSTTKKLSFGFHFNKFVSPEVMQFDCR